tara:strand:- start:3275 stop:3481 length:207 start_codon:yes stop_codon:yes gene_type:complete
MTNLVEFIKEVKSEINNRAYRVQKIVVGELNHYIIDYKVDFGYMYCTSTDSKEQMENYMYILLNQKLQ